MTDSLPDEVRNQIQAAIFAGRKIRAIKAYRQATNASLKDAKDRIEEMEKELRETNPDQFSASAGKGCVSMMLCFLCALGLLLWLSR